MHDCALAIHWRYTSTTRKYFFFLPRISPPRPPGWSWIRIFVWRKVTIERPKYLWVAIFLIAGRNIGRISCFSIENKLFAGEPLCLLTPPQIVRHVLYPNPAFTGVATLGGVPIATTDIITGYATTGYVTLSLRYYATLYSPIFTGSPKIGTK